MKYFLPSRYIENPPLQSPWWKRALKRLIYGGNFTYKNQLQESLLYQWHVYQFAREIIMQNEIGSLLDCGCGIGAKLDRLIKDICPVIYGVDNVYNIRNANRLWQFGNWLSADLDNPSFVLDRKFDLIMAIDVVEHLRSPEKLLKWMIGHCHQKTFLLISTPDRDMIYGKGHIGPPDNPSHIREWNVEEFSSFLRANALRIIEHRHLSSVKSDLRDRTCQVILSVVS